MGFNSVMTSYRVFETPLGPGAIAWGEAGVVGIQLPEADEQHLRTRIRRRFADATEGEPPAEVAEAIVRIKRLLDGQRTDLSEISLDMSRVPELAQRVYQEARNIGPGQTATYGQIAAKLGDPLLAREVGQALARNPFPIVVPCHRVLAAGGKLGGFSAAGGVATKQKLLAIERANVSWQLPLGVA
jgi:methylated-DNA-[protein]-cysteine S-methyltransferase